jgi:thiol:disulfide interchange protein DsbD
MRRCHYFNAIVVAVCFTVSAARAAHTGTQLLLSADTAKPGDTVMAAVQLKMEPGWHTYWKNPGEAGQATQIKWTLPPGITAGEIQWPLPQKLPPAEITTYGYEDEVMLLVPLTLGKNLPAVPLNLSAKVSWLECKESCIPASANVQATLNLNTQLKTSTNAVLIESWKKQVPQTNAFYQFQGRWENPSDGDIRSLIISNDRGGADKNFKYDSVDFFPAASENFEIQAATEILSPWSASIALRKQVKKFSGDWPNEISGVIVVQLGKMRTGYEANVPIAETAPTNLTASATVVQQPLWQMLLFAFIGGLILNIMPCVLPVIALKILGFVSEARSEPRRVRNLGLIYALGVLISFLALAAIVIGVKAAGHHAGWGMQFGSPIFIVCLATLVTLVALNLFGVFEVTLGGRALDTAGELAAKHGAPGAFFNGVLATILATPCTAPFLSAALGFAFAQSSAVIVLFFLTVGLGLAAPYILLSWHPAWLKFLPKPGAWMEKFKIAMGFPMLATVIWLCNVATSSYGKNVLWLGIFLIVVAFATWIFGEFVQRGRHKTVAAIVALILLVGGYSFALEKELDWRATVPETIATGSLKESADGIDWQRWSPEAVAQARAEGRPVLVDFTADWCLTCQLNKKTSLEISSVRKKLKDLNAVAFIGDYTRTPANMFDELQRFGRPSVPLVLVYPKNPALPPIVLPEVLTPGLVLDALDKASQ